MAAWLVEHFLWVGLALVLLLLGLKLVIGLLLKRLMDASAAAAASDKAVPPASTPDRPGS